MVVNLDNILLLMKLDEFKYEVHDDTLIIISFIVDI